MLILNSENFESEVLQSRIPVLVDFYADWCGPCQAMGPVLEGLEPAFADSAFVATSAKEAATAGKRKVKIGKVNVDENQTLAEKYGVMSIPTLLFFNKGEIVKILIGLQTKETLVEIVKNLKS